ncbi:MAG: hypothetical protein AAF740_10970, partial [Bacteroidota bacterium]
MEQQSTLPPKARIERLFEGDSYIWIVVFLLAFMSILVVYSATGALAFRHTEGDTEYYLFKHSFLIFLCLG